MDLPILCKLLVRVTPHRRVRKCKSEACLIELSGACKVPSTNVFPDASAPLTFFGRPCHRLVNSRHFLVLFLQDLNRECIEWIQPRLQHLKQNRPRLTHHHGFPCQLPSESCSIGFLSSPTMRTAYHSAHLDQDLHINSTCSP